MKTIYSKNSRWFAQPLKSQKFRHDPNFERTKKNDKGEIVSALYGKIYNPIDFKVFTNGMNVQFAYYLNPTPNDRNTEFDPNQNLFPRARGEGGMLP